MALVRLGYELSGNREGHLVVFLHGFLGSRTDWDDVTGALGDAFHCLTLDLPGHGDSRIDGAPDSCGFVDTATALFNLIDDAGAATFSLVGYSMGGRLALYMTTIYAMRIDHLVLESASPGLRGPTERDARRIHDERVAQRLETQDLGVFLTDWYEQTLFASLHGRPGRVTKLIQRRLGNDGSQLAKALRGLGTGSQPSLWDEWASNHVPSLLVAGALDAKYVQLAREMGRVCPSARVTVVPECGHNVHLENPTDYTGLLREFLQGTLMTRE